jgi:hypothetical protein
MSERNPLPAGALRYEVTAHVPESMAPDYETYLRREHVPDLMATGCFVGAEFSRDSEASGADGSTDLPGAGPRVRFRSTYVAPGRDALDRYLAQHAPRLRAHALERFSAGAIEFTRAVWEVRETWSAGQEGDGGRGRGRA